LEVLNEDVLRAVLDLKRLSLDTVNTGREKISGEDLHKHPATSPLFYNRRLWVEQQGTQEGVFRIHYTGRAIEDSRLPQHFSEEP